MLLDYGKRRLAFIIILLFTLITLSIRDLPTITLLAAALVIVLALATIIVKHMLANEEEY